MEGWKLMGCDIISDRIAYWRDRKAEGYQPATYILDELTAIYHGVKLAETGFDRTVAEEIGHVDNSSLSDGNSKCKTPVLTFDDLMPSKSSK